MKSLILIIIYVASFIFIFLFLSLIGILWENYFIVIKNGNWFFTYLFIIGWWVSIFPAKEYYVKNKEYLDKIF